MNGKQLIFMALTLCALVSGCASTDQPAPNPTALGAQTPGPTAERATLVSTERPGAAPEPAADFERTDMEHARQIMEREDGYILLDVRTLDEYNEGHIPGAICLPNEEIGDQAPEQLADRDQLILVYCRSGRRSQQAAEKLAKLGYTHVVEIGGILDWDGELEK